METEVITAAQGVGLAHGGDLTMIGLFLRADLIVKSVMLLLLFVSVWCWGIMFSKAFQLKRLGVAAGNGARSGHGVFAGKGPVATASVRTVSPMPAGCVACDRA